MQYMKIVQKYGGTSVGSIDRIKNVANRIKKSVENGDIVVVVVSAMSGETNKLVNLVSEFSKDPIKREVDVVLSTGENASSALLAIYLNELGLKAKSLNAYQSGMKTDSNYSEAKILGLNTFNIDKLLEDGVIPVVSGFQGVDEENNVTALGRGGSDTSAIAIAIAIDADECQIFTDVDGICCADPRIVPTAKKLELISLDEMAELASSGAKVLHDRCVALAQQHKKVKVIIASSLKDINEDIGGTIIVYSEKDFEHKFNKKIKDYPEITSVTKEENVAEVNLIGVSDTPGMASKIMQKIANKNIFVDIIVQTDDVNGKTNIDFSIARKDIEVAEKELAASLKELGIEKLVIKSDLAKINVVGIGLKVHYGIASKVFSALAENNINIELISTSDIKITILVKKDLADKAIKAICSKFNLD